MKHEKLIITEPLIRKLLATVDAGLTRGLGDPVPGKMCIEAAISYALGEEHTDGPSCVNRCVRAGKIRLNDSPWSSDAARAKGMRVVAIAQLGSKGIVRASKYAALLTLSTIQKILPVALRAASQLNPRYMKKLEAAATLCENQRNLRDASIALEASYFTVYTAAAHAAAAFHASQAAFQNSHASFAANNASSALTHASAALTHLSSSATATVFAVQTAIASSNAVAACAASSAASSAALAASQAARDEILKLSASLMVQALSECRSPGCEWLWLVNETPTSL